MNINFDISILTKNKPLVTIGNKSYAIVNWNSGGDSLSAPTLERMSGGIIPDSQRLESGSTITITWLTNHKTTKKITADFLIDDESRGVFKGQPVKYAQIKRIAA